MLEICIVNPPSPLEKHLIFSLLIFISYKDTCHDTALQVWVSIYHMFSWHCEYILFLPPRLNRTSLFHSGTSVLGTGVQGPHTDSASDVVGLCQWLVRDCTIIYKVSSSSSLKLYTSNIVIDTIFFFRTCLFNAVCFWQLPCLYKHIHRNYIVYWLWVWDLKSLRLGSNPAFTLSSCVGKVVNLLVS